MRTPDLSRLAVGAPYLDQRGVFEKMLDLTFHEVVRRELALNRNAIPLALAWEDGNESYVASGGMRGVPYYLLRLQQSPPTLHVENQGQPVASYAIGWGSLDSVLDAVNRYFTTVTPLWRAVWPEAPADLGDASRELLELHVQNAGTQEQRLQAAGYQGFWYACIRGAQRAAADEHVPECLGHPKEKWMEHVSAIRSLMVRVPSTVYCASVAEERVVAGKVPAALPSFVSASINFRAMDAGKFDGFSFHNESSDPSDEKTMLAFTLLPGTRVLPVFAMAEAEPAKAWEYEVLIDEGQLVSEQEVRRDSMGRKTIMLTVRPAS